MLFAMRYTVFNYPSCLITSVLILYYLIPEPSLVLGTDVSDGSEHFTYLKGCINWLEHLRSKRELKEKKMD